MDLEQLLIAHALIGRLTPKQVDDLADMLDYLHSPPLIPAPSLLPLRDLRKAVLVEFGTCRATEQLTHLIQGNALLTTMPPVRVHDDL